MALRAKSLGYGTADSANVYIRQNLTELLSLSSFAQDDGQLEVRLYEDPPSVSVTRLDSRMIVGFFLSGLHSIRGPHLVVGEGSWLCECVSRQFETVWLRAERYAFPASGQAATSG